MATASSPNDERRLYSDLAWTWRLMSPPEDYIEEAGDFREAILSRTQIETRTLLHLGCGGGHIDRWLKERFEVTGVDVSEQMLTLARDLNPEATYLIGDMRTIRLGRTFDAVIAADAIDYMLSEADLRAAFETAYRHLKTGGIFCTYPDNLREEFAQNETKSWTGRSETFEIAFIENSFDPDPDDTTYESVFVYLIRQNGQLTVETDRHLGGLYPRQTWLDLLTDVSFEVEEVKGVELNHLFACRKRPIAGK